MTQPATKNFVTGDKKDAPPVTPGDKGAQVETPQVTETTAAKKSDEAPEAPPSGKSKGFTLRDATNLPEDESVVRVRAERAKWTGF